MARYSLGAFGFLTSLARRPRASAGGTAESVVPGVEEEAKEEEEEGGGAARALVQARSIEARAEGLPDGLEEVDEAREKAGRAVEDTVAAVPEGLLEVVVEVEPVAEG